MVRRDQLRDGLVYDQCAELLALEERLYELDSLLATATAVRRTRPSARCVCGTPILWGSHFCANCGRTVAGAPAGAACPSCGNAVPADAQFCASCGHRLAGQNGDAQPQAVADDAPPAATDRPVTDGDEAAAG